MSEWSFKDWLEALAYTVAVIGGIAGSFIYLNSTRKESIATIRKEITRPWTNEGDIASTEVMFITVDLKNVDGDIVRSLSTTAYDRPLEVHAKIGWFRAILEISELRGRSLLPIAKVKVKLTGNNNRLDWKRMGNQEVEILPKHTTLWPGAVGVSRRPLMSV